MAAQSDGEAVARPLFPHLSLYHRRKRPYHPDVPSRSRPRAPPPGSLTENDGRPARERVRLVGGRLPQGHVPRACGRTLGKALLKGAVVVRVAPRIHPSQGRRRQTPASARRHGCRSPIPQGPSLVARKRGGGVLYIFDEVAKRHPSPQDRRGALPTLLTNFVRFFAG
jgi:hypothetical protein